ncbi:MAG: glycosyltransferase family 39 protein [Candidatus Omnitrophica bacterium]|nr:glycosyltransferase family 39 protein [Candidatus Omnitrophota bacterium]
MHRAFGLLAGMVLLSALAVQALGFVSVKAPTADEFAHHIANGYSYWKGDFRMNPVSPPLPRMLAAFPLLFLQAKAPLDHPSWETIDSPEFARQFFYHYNHEPDRFVFWARLPILAVSLCFAMAVFLCARSLFGPAAAWISLLLYVFCPDIIAHSSLATSDLTVAFFFFLSLWALEMYLERPSARAALLVGALAALTFLSKLTALFLFPIFGLMVLFSGEGKAVRMTHVLLFAGALLGVLWAGYGFEVKPLLVHTPDPAKKIEFIRQLAGDRAVHWAMTVPIPLSTFVAALAGLFFTRAAGTNAFLMGEWSTRGWWYYYFVAFAVKNTLPFVALSVTGFVQACVANLGRIRKTFLVVPIAFFFIATMPDRAQAGIRYFLPVYPLLMILAAAWAAALLKRGVLWRSVIVVLLAYHVVSVVTTYPHYLSYFNEVAGGPRKGYRWLRDSNLDWGQDLKALGDVLRQIHADEVVLFYYGSADPAQYGIRARPVREAEMRAPEHTVYALAAHHMDSFAWYDDYTPDAWAGNTIRVYDFRNKALP